MAEETPETGDPRIVTRPERNAATSFRDNAAGPPSEGRAVTDRKNDLGSVTNDPALANSTLGSRQAERAKAEKAAAKQVAAEDTENKQVSRSRTGTKRK